MRGGEAVLGLASGAQVVAWMVPCIAALLLVRRGETLVHDASSPQSLDHFASRGGVWKARRIAHLYQRLQIRGGLREG